MAPMPKRFKLPTDLRVFATIEGNEFVVNLSAIIVAGQTIIVDTSSTHRLDLRSDPTQDPPIGLPQDGLYEFYAVTLFPNSNKSVQAYALVQDVVVAS